MGIGREGKKGARQAVTSLPVFPCTFFQRFEGIFEFGSLSLAVSLKPKSFLLARPPPPNHTPALCSDWLRDTEERESRARAVVFPCERSKNQRLGKGGECSVCSAHAGVSFSVRTTRKDLPREPGSSSPLRGGWLLCCRGYVMTGAGPEDPRLPGTDRLSQLQVQDANGEGQACHHAADGQRGGRPLRRAERRRHARRRRSRRQGASCAPLGRHGEWQRSLTHLGCVVCLCVCVSVCVTASSTTET